MPKFTRLLPLLLALFSLPATAEQGWVEVKSPNFSVITDGGPKTGREIALRFEQMRTVFGQIFRRSKINLPVPLQIVAFRNAKEMRSFVPMFKGKPVELSGLFMPGEDRSFILLDLAADNKWEAVFHEYAHQLLNGNFSHMAPWFDEGFADYFASMRITGNSFTIGEPPTGALEVMSRTRLMPVSTLFQVEHQSETYNRSGDPRHLFYAESWLMVHMIFDRQLLKQADDYFRLINDQHTPVDDAMQRAFGKDPKQFDKEFAAYLNAGSGKVLTGHVAGTLDANSFPVSPVAPLDLRVTLADLHFHSPDHRAEAAKEYEQILAEKPDSSGAHRGLGYAYLYGGEFDKALDHFRQAARLSTTDPRVYYYSGLAIARRSMTTGRPPAELLAEMKGDLQKAIALDPGFADPYSVLGFANMIEGDYPSAVTNCKKAAELNPRSELYALNLARAYLAAHQPMEAKALLDKLKDSSDKNVSAQAQQLYSRTERAAGEVTTAERHKIPETYDAPQWRRSQEEIEREPDKPAETAGPDTRPTKYLRGQLVSVDCAAAPAATLTISSGGKTLHMLTPDTKKLLLIGADEFSCTWKNRKVLVNYKAGGKADGDLVSLEVQ